MTLGEIRERVLAESWDKARGGHMAAINSRFALDHFGAHTKIAKVDREAIQGYARALAKDGNAPATINRKLAALSKMLTYAHDTGHLAVKPKIVRQRESGGRIRFLTPAEEARVLPILDGIARDAVMFLLDTGARCGEMLRLRWTDIADGRVTFWETKNGSPRTVPLTARVREMLESRRAAGGGKPFPIAYHVLHASWDRARATLGFAEDPQFVLHMLRHTCASRLVQRGADIRKVKEWLGHKSIAVTLRYAHLAPDSLEGMAGLLEPTGLLEGTHG